MQPVSPISVANGFLEVAKAHGEALANMKLQKLVYFAHGWHLALFDEQLIDARVKAWNFGPVIPPLYNALKKFSGGNVEGPITRKAQGTGETIEFPPPQDDVRKRLIERIWQIYGRFTASQLSAFTHQPDEPWTLTYEKTPFEVIPDDLIKEHFKKQLKPVGVS